MNRAHVTPAEWMDHKRRSLLDLAREAGHSTRERAESYMVANKVKVLLGPVR